MSITKVGSSYNFIYNTKTGKLSTKDGSKNEFVDVYKRQGLRVTSIRYWEKSLTVSRWKINLHTKNCME